MTSAMGSPPTNGEPGTECESVRVQVKATSTTKFCGIDRRHVKRFRAAVGRQWWVLMYRLGELRVFVRGWGG